MADEIPENPPATRKPVSEKQRLANVANAQKSSGPRTYDGKQKCKWNSLRHGMRAEHDVIPGESDEEFEELLAAHREEYHPETPLQELFVRRAASAFQKLERGDRVEHALAQRLQTDAALKITERIEVELEKVADQIGQDPVAAIRLLRPLRKSLAGCLWIRDLWLGYQKRLETKPRLLPHQIDMTLFLVGKYRQDVLLDDPVATRWMVAHLGSMVADGRRFIPENVLNNTGSFSWMTQGELRVRAEELIEALPPRLQALKLLKGYIAEELEKIDEQIEIIKERNEEDRGLDVAATEIPLTPEGKQLTTYVATQRQSYDAALRRLDRLRAPRKPGAGRASDPAASPAGGSTNPAVPESAAPAAGPAEEQAGDNFPRSDPNVGVAGAEAPAEAVAQAGTGVEDLGRGAEVGDSTGPISASEDSPDREATLFTNRPILEEEPDRGPVTMADGLGDVLLQTFGSQAKVEAFRARVRQHATDHVREQRRLLLEKLDAEERDARLTGRQPYVGDWEKRLAEARQGTDLDGEAARSPPDGGAPAD